MAYSDRAWRATHVSWYKRFKKSQVYTDAAACMWSKRKEKPGKRGYLCGREATQGIPLLGEPFDHRQGRRHIAKEGVSQKAIGCHLHLCWHHCEQTSGFLLGFWVLFGEMCTRMTGGTEFYYSFLHRPLCNKYNRVTDLYSMYFFQ